MYPLFHSPVSRPSLSLPPGAVAYVLRTGFSSSQGSQLQLIEFAQQSVGGDSKETGGALLLLLGFALAAAAYVFVEGMRKKEKTTHELLLKCVIIITSVVPKQFPLQMAMAVNMALMTLFKTGIFCTEPFRVPTAGKITHIFFDKVCVVSGEWGVGRVGCQSSAFLNLNLDVCILRGILILTRLASFSTFCARDFVVPTRLAH